MFQNITTYCQICQTMDHKLKYLSFQVTTCMQMLSSIVDAPSMPITYELDIKYVICEAWVRSHIASHQFVATQALEVTPRQRVEKCAICTFLLFSPIGMVGSIVFI